MKALPTAVFLLALATSRLTAAPDASSLVRLRGANAECSSLQPSEAALLDNWKCNVVRVVIDADKDAPAPTTAGPLDPYRKSLEKLKTFLPAARQRHINVIVCLNNSYNRSFDQPFWDSAEANVKARSYIVDFWRAFAKQYKDESEIVGYDVLEQPNDPNPGARVWQSELLPAVIEAVRASNKDVWLVIQASPWGSPGGFVSMVPVKDPKAIYGFIASAPGAYTRQGIGAQPGTRGTIAYPGPVPDGSGVQKVFDRMSLVASMQGASDFAIRTRQRVMVVNFGVVRWAPGNDKWIRDMISIFEEHHWDWIYGTMFGYDGGNPTDDPNGMDRLATDQGKFSSPAFEALKEGWRKNSN